MKLLILLSAILIMTIKINAQQTLRNEETLSVIISFKNEFIKDVKVSELPYTGNDKIDNICKKYNAVAIRKVYSGKKTNRLIFSLQFPAGSMPEKIINDLNNTHVLEYAEPDYKGQGGGVQGTVPNDQYYYRQWGLKNDGTFSLSTATAGADIDMENAWNIEQGDSNIIVAVMDGGAKLNHPEFAGRLWINSNEIPGNGIDDDGNGFIDDTNGWDFANTDNDPTDDYGHGTNVSGIICANANNAIGYAGVDWHCKLMVLKGLDNNNSGLYSWWAAAIYYATDNGARAINLSVGGSSVSTTLQNSISYAIANNVVIVACMMNTNSNTTYYPAAYPNVIAVGSVNPDDTRSNPFFWSASSGSNYGAHISVVAPGNYVYGLNHLSNTDYSYYWGGTSQATPHVTGLVSLLLAQDPSRTPAQIKTIIETTAEDQVGSPVEDTPGWDQYYGHGRINAFNALSLFTSVAENNQELFDFNVFPNPSTGTISIKLATAANLPLDIRITNGIGQLIFQDKLMQQKNIIQIKTDPGFYIATVRQGTFIQSKKLIIE